MKEENNKGFVFAAWLMLVTLSGMAVILTYLKFFYTADFDNNIGDNIEETPVDNSEAEATRTMLEEIVSNFNQNDKITGLTEQGIEVSAILNNYSIFISYTNDVTTTFEFTYSDSVISVRVDSNTDNLDKFKVIYEILIYAVQERLGNYNDLSGYISNFLSDAVEYDGLTKDVDDNVFIYKMNVTKSLTNDNTDEETVDADDMDY